MKRSVGILIFVKTHICTYTMLKTVIIWLCIFINQRKLTPVCLSPSSLSASDTLEFYSIPWVCGYLQVCLFLCTCSVSGIL